MFRQNPEVAFLGAGAQSFDEYWHSSAAQVVGQIEKHGLARIDDYVDPYGSIVAGDWQKDMPWRDRC